MHVHSPAPHNHHHAYMQPSIHPSMHTHTDPHLRAHANIKVMIEKSVCTSESRVEDKNKSMLVECNLTV